MVIEISMMTESTERYRNVNDATRLCIRIIRVKVNVTISLVTFVPERNIEIIIIKATVKQMVSLKIYFQCCYTMKV